MSATAFQEQLICLLNEAMEVRVREHSSPHDLQGRPCGWHVYGEALVSHPDRQRLIGRLEAMDPAPQEVFAACIPAYHHTIEFVSEQDRSTMRICFLCAVIEFGPFSGDQPWAIYGVLAEFLRELGLQADRDWMQLAAEAERIRPGGEPGEGIGARPKRPKLP